MKRNNTQQKGRNKEKPSESDCQAVARRMLRDWPLPQPDEDADKEGRGRVLVVGGSREVPGGALLAGNAALRAGAGKLRMATGESITLPLGIALPEARVFSVPETASGAIDPSAAEALANYANDVQATLIGPGMVDAEATAQLLKNLLPLIERPFLILDAAAMAVLAEAPDVCRHLEGRVVLTPHAGEVAEYLGMDPDAIRRNPSEAASRAARRFGAVVAMKGADTFIAGPEGQGYVNRTGNVGLATSGSGDTLAGIIAGLAARGASPLQAAVWGVYLHGSAGDRLARRMGGIGFLAHELLAEIPVLMAEFHPPYKPSRKRQD